MRGRHILAVFVGVVGSFALSLAFGLALGIVLIAYFSMQGMPLREITVQLNTEHVAKWPAYLWMCNGVGGLAMFIGGFVVGWIARTGQVVCGLVTGIISLLLSAPFFFWYPLWFDVVAAVVTVAAATLGAYCAGLLLKPRSALTSPTASSR